MGSVFQAMGRTSRGSRILPAFAGHPFRPGQRCGDVLEPEQYSEAPPFPWGKPRAALDFLPEIPGHGGKRGDIKGQAVRWNNIGLAYRALGQNDRAMDCYLRSKTLN